MVCYSLFNLELPIYLSNFAPVQMPILYGRFMSQTCYWDFEPMQNCLFVWVLPHFATKLFYWSSRIFIDLCCISSSFLLVDEAENYIYRGIWNHKFCFRFEKCTFICSHYVVWVLLTWILPGLCLFMASLHDDDFVIGST